MKNNFIFMCLAIGMLSNGFYNDAFAANATEQTAEIQERILTRQDASRLIEEMEARGSTELVIPEGYTSIGEWAFEGCAIFTSVNIPNSVKSIGCKAFFGCENLEFVKIPNSVKSIGGRAFDGCYMLRSVEIPDSVESIGEDAFGICYGCTFTVPNDNIKQLLINSGVSKYRIAIEGEENQWWIPEQNGKIVIPDNIVRIDDRMFEGREDITSIEILGNVAYIGEDAFSCCAGLTSINIPYSVTSIGDRAFYYCNSLNRISIPNHVQSIGDLAFLECFNLEYVDIPDSVESIGRDAFRACKKLKEIRVHSEKVKKLVIDSESGIAHDKIIIMQHL